MTLLHHRIRTIVGILALAVVVTAQTAVAVCPYDPNCLSNPYGAGSPYKPDGLR
jgi:hypothetical protein